MAMIMQQQHQNTQRWRMGFEPSMHGNNFNLQLKICNGRSINAGATRIAGIMQDPGCTQCVRTPSLAAVKTLSGMCSSSQSNQAPSCCVDLGRFRNLANNSAEVVEQQQPG